MQLDPYRCAGMTQSEFGLGGSVVVKLVSNLPCDQYILYFDNFFTSLPLLEQLAAKNIRATGTVRVNRIDKIMSSDG